MSANVIELSAASSCVSVRVNVCGADPSATGDVPFKANTIVPEASVSFG